VQAYSENSRTVYHLFLGSIRDHHFNWSPPLLSTSCDVDVFCLFLLRHVVMSFWERKKRATGKYSYGCVSKQSIRKEAKNVPMPRLKSKSVLASLICKKTNRLFKSNLEFQDFFTTLQLLMLSSNLPSVFITFTSKCPIFEVLCKSETEIKHFP